MKTPVKILTLATSLLLIGACSKEETNYPLSVTASQLSFNLEENNIATSELSISGADDEVTLSIANSDVPGWLLVDVSDPTKVTLSVSELKNEGTYTLDIQAEDGSDTVDLSFSIVANNTSVEAVLNELAAYEFAVGKFAEQAEELEFASRALALAIMTDDTMTLNLRSQLMHQLTSSIDGPERASLISATQQSYDIQYSNNKITEDDLISAIAEIKTLVDVFTLKTSLILNEISAFLPESKMALDTSSAFMLQEHSNISRFVGNPQLGELSDGIWVFKQDYTFLEAIVSPSSLACNAQ